MIFLCIPLQILMIRKQYNMGVLREPNNLVQGYLMDTRSCFDIVIHIMYRKWYDGYSFFFFSWLLLTH